MVPCQPRQLVILSLPFAALVAFFWYKRRKSLSRSDPGGTSTSALTKTVDRPVKSCEANSKVEDGKESSGRIINDCFTTSVEDVCTSPPKVEEFVVDKVEHKEVCSSPLIIEKIAAKKIEDIFISQKSEIDEPIISAVNDELIEVTPIVEENDIVCNGEIVHIPDETGAPSVVYKEVENQANSLDFESNRIFHSTIIEDDKHTEDIDKNSSSDNNQLVEKSFEHEQEQVPVDNICQSNISENKKSKEITVTNQESEQQTNIIPIEEQSTVENITFKEDIKEASIVAEKSSEEKNPVDETVKSDLISSTINVTTEKIEDISADTGLGSREVSATEETEDSVASMAQGQKAEEKAQNNTSAAGLEHKLSSLGLDTQQPIQRIERDSANHSPAEVMLNSPAISTFSDVHSEGSSDSGKGCSDVVTPPSRTPAGGSSVAGDQVPIIYEFVLPQVIVGRLIGRHGAFLHDIRAKTHTNVFIKRHPETNTLKICAIEGTQQDIDAALKMIRQKFPVRRFPELTLERVTFVKNSCLPISPENLQLHLVEGVNNDVLLSSLITAGHFFLQLPMHISYQSLYRLACIMNSNYNTQESPPLPDPQPDVVCVAPAHGGWYRAQILSVDEEAHTSDIKFLDYGGFVTVDNSLLRQIRGDFLLLPFQAVECALANVIPAGGEEEWSEEAKQFVQLMTSQQTLQAQVYDYTETGLPLVYLYCTQFYQSPSDTSGFETRVVLLNQELVTRGYAELIDWSQEEGQTPATESS